MEVGSHAEPQYYLDYINAWAADKKTIRMVITGTEINTLIYIEDVTQSEKDGTGDRYATVAIREYCDLEAKEVAPNGGTHNNGRANDASSSRKTQTYTIVPGNTLSIICRRYYGKSTAKYYNALAKYNGIKNPHLIYPGRTIKIPPENVLRGDHHEHLSDQIQVRYPGHHQYPDALDMDRRQGYHHPTADRRGSVHRKQPASGTGDRRPGHDDRRWREKV